MAIADHPSNDKHLSNAHEAVTQSPATLDPTLLRIRDALRGLRYGSVNVIVQDGLVIQIDRVEKFRLKKPLDK